MCGQVQLSVTMIMSGLCVCGQVQLSVTMIMSGLCVWTGSAVGDHDHVCLEDAAKMEEAAVMAGTWEGDKLICVQVSRRETG